MDNLTQNQQEDSLVIFTHIPKTAGTSLRHIVQSQFQPSNVFEFYNLKVLPPKVRKGIEKYNNLSEAKKKSIKFISGHVGFGLHEFLSRPCTYITVLRDPVKRVISYYYFLLRNQHPIVEDKTLSEFVETFGGVQNSMTCYLSGLTLQAQLQDPSIDLKSQQFAPETLAKAKVHLKDRFEIVGFVDRFDETCILLERTLGWNIPSYYVKKNVAKQPNPIQDISPETISLIQKFNELDIELYSYAREVFESKIRQQDDTFQEDLHRFKLAQQSSSNQLYFKLHASYKRMAYKVYEKLS
ncbi:MAG: sulfotransferase family 2 domain-containing protein [Cyanobacteria bacterium P01_G01_bin.19]